MNTRMHTYTVCTGITHTFRVSLRESGNKQITIDLPFHMLCNLIHCGSNKVQKKWEILGDRTAKRIQRISLRVFLLLFYFELFNLLPFIKIQLKLKLDHANQNFFFEKECRINEERYMKCCLWQTMLFCAIFGWFQLTLP